MTDDRKSDLFTPRSAAESRALYDDWSGHYDADMADWGYATPGRVAMALRLSGANLGKLVLDYGCGTGLSGMALKAAGFEVVDGMDISRDMLAEAEKRGVYRQVFHTEPGHLGHVTRGAYPIIVAAGVISLGAAPPETLDLLLGALPSGGILAFSLNAPSLADRSYTDRLDIALLDPEISVIFEEDGPHLPAKGITSTVFLLQKT